MLSTKKPKTSQPRTLGDCPEWQEAVNKQAELHAELAAAEQFTIQRDGSPSPTERDARVQAAADKLLGKPAKAPGTGPNRQAAIDRLEACKRATAEHGRRMTALQFDLQRQLYTEWEAEHTSTRKRIAEGILELKRAFDDEQKLAEQMARAGAISTSILGRRLFLNFSACSSLPTTIRAMKTKAFRRCNANLMGEGG